MLSNYARLAVYGTLKKGFSNNVLLSDSEYLGKEKIPNYIMFDLGFFPAVVQSDNYFDKILVEVYKVHKDVLRDCDMLEGYRGKNQPYNMYNRVKIDTSFGKTFLYEWNGNPKYYTMSVTDGEWTDTYKEFPLWF